MMNRHTIVLVAVVLLAGVAGCMAMDDGNSATPTNNTTDSPEEPNDTSDDVVTARYNYDTTQTYTTNSGNTYSVPQDKEFVIATIHFEPGIGPERYDITTNTNESWQHHITGDPPVVEETVTAIVPAGEFETFELTEDSEYSIDFEHDESIDVNSSHDYD